MLLLLKIIAVGAGIVFFGCVLTIMACITSLLLQIGRSAASWDPFTMLARYRAAKSCPDVPVGIAHAEMLISRARRIAIRAWLVALIAGVSMVAFALISGQN